MNRDLELQTALDHHYAGRLAEAETIYRTLLAAEPNDPQTLFLFGVLAIQKGLYETAADILRRSLALNPHSAEAHNALGDAQHNLGQLSAAVESFNTAIRLQPANAVLYCNLGNALKKQRSFDEAIEAYEHSLRLAPNSLETLNNLGNTFKSLGRFDEAIAIYERALALQPDFAASHYNLGVTLYAEQRYDQAAAAYEEAIRLQPSLAAAHTSLGNVFKDQGRIPEALAAYRRAAELEPKVPDHKYNLAYTLNFDPAADPAAILAEAREWERRFAPSLAARPAHRNEPSPDRRLRLGYVSADFRNHPVGNGILPLLREHDHERFEIYLYSAVTLPDELTNEFHSLADHWRDVQELNADHAADLVRCDEIDILVDLTLYMEGSQLPLFARKPAPIQVTYLGYCGTTGLSAIDYRLSDPYLDPPGADSNCYSEETFRLPKTYWCYEPRGPTPGPGPLPAQENGYVTFGSLNNFAKVSPATLDLWSEILAATPNSRLVLHAPESSCRESALRHLRAAPDHIEFVKQQPWELYLQTWQKIDIALDPFPYCGGITTLDALWMGVPLISLAGRAAVNRSGRSILSNVGLPELAVDTQRQYLQAAIGLAGDRERLAALRAGLQNRMEQSPLRDARGFARDVEAAWREMWRRWCGGMRRTT